MAGVRGEQSGQVRPLERSARELLDRAGCHWIPLWHNSKCQKSTGNVTQRAIPPFNAAASLPRGLFVLDVDGPPGMNWFNMLRAGWPETLLLDGRRGPRAVYRLPQGLYLPQRQNIFPDLDLLTDKFVAPGSIVKGTYYAVLELIEIATAPEDDIIRLAETLGTDPTARIPSTHNIRLVVPDRFPFSREARDKARAKRIGRNARLPERMRVAQSDQQLQVWLNETRVGYRHQAIWAAKELMKRRGETFEDFCAAILSSPVRAELEGHGNPRRRLRKAWDKDGGADTPFRYHDGIVGRDARERAAVAAAWGGHARSAVRDHYADDSARRQDLLRLLELHASWMSRYGYEYHLSRRIMRCHLGGCGNKKLDRLLAVLIDELGLLHRRPEDRPTVDAQKWELLINKEPIGLFFFAWVSSTSPPPDLHLLYDEEVNALLAQTIESEIAERQRRGTGHKVPKILRLPPRPLVPLIATSPHLYGHATVMQNTS